jgi:hypothetical protein
MQENRQGGQAITLETCQGEGGDPFYSRFPYYARDEHLTVYVLGISEVGGQTASPSQLRLGLSNIAVVQVSSG